MSKEELEKEADNYAEGMAKYYASTHEDCIPSQFEKYLRNAYISSAEPREKQIQIDAKQIRALQKQNGELTDKVRDLEEKLANTDYQLEGRDLEIKELKAQIEKMKSDVRDEIGFVKTFNELHTYNVLNNLLNRWEIKEK